VQSQTKIFSHLVRDYMRPAPLVLPLRTTVSQLLTALSDAGRSSALVSDFSGRLVGIVTERDVTRRIALRCSGEETLADVMTTPVRAVRAEEQLYMAIARMRRFGWRHMPVVEDSGRPLGTIDLIDALTVASEQIVRQIERISHEGSLDGLSEVKAAQVELADDLSRDNVPAPDIQQLLSDINRDIHRRVIESALGDMAAEGWGDPPVAFSLIIMGSGGRGENYLFPDQDNGFILEDYPDREHGRIDSFFVELAERMTRNLDAIGFPLCRGFVMATNPVWRKTLSQWLAQVGLWGRKRSTIAVQLADIFFDFRLGYGDPARVGVLRESVTTMARGSPAFLAELQRESARQGVALGWFGRLITERDKAGHRGEINLKHAGTLPLVSAVRLLALKHGVTATPTLERIAALNRGAVLGDDEADYLAGAFRHITTLLLRQQIADFKAGRPVGSHVHPDRMSEREKDILVDSFKAIEQLRGKVDHEFTAGVF